MDNARNALVERVKRPVTVGFGPRFLHSTGQFHKGGTPDGVFVQVLVQPQHDIQIPGYPFDFATLVNAQARGDRDVLVSRGRPVLTVRVADEASLEKFLAAAGHAR
jgi:glucose-6-phosphate isomerase